MLSLLRDPSLLPHCILAGVGAMFLVLAFALPSEQVVALVAGTAVVVGIALARLRRRTEKSLPAMARFGAKG